MGSLVTELFARRYQDTSLGVFLDLVLIYQGRERGKGSEMQVSPFYLFIGDQKSVLESTEKSGMQ